ncbi:hypothetical protein J2X69_002949 [Algoriphagus sp. 4150]|nr:hypothetical protein [Algoriphagus sp. 4150]
MSDTLIYIIIGIVIAHFVVGIGFLIYKLSGGSSSKKK